MAMSDTKFAVRGGTLRAVCDTRSTSPAQQADADADAIAAIADHRADPPADRLAYSVAEAATITGLSRDLLYDQMRTGQLAYLKVGRRRIITRQDLEAFLARPAYR
jgi:excisionase family DNA binding protein